MYTFLYWPIYEFLYWPIYEDFIYRNMLQKSEIAIFEKIKIFIYRSKNVKFRHISVRKWFLKNLHISVNIRLSYIGQYMIQNIDRYMLTYSEWNLLNFIIHPVHWKVDGHQSKWTVINQSGRSWAKMGVLSEKRKPHWLKVAGQKHFIWYYWKWTVILL